MTSAGSQHCAIAVAITSGAARRTKASAPGASSRSTSAGSGGRSAGPRRPWTAAATAARSRAGNSITCVSRWARIAARSPSPKRPAAAAVASASSTSRAPCCLASATASASLRRNRRAPAGCRAATSQRSAPGAIARNACSSTEPAFGRRSSGPAAAADRAPRGCSAGPAWPRAARDLARSCGCVGVHDHELVAVAADPDAPSTSFDGTEWIAPPTEIVDCQGTSRVWPTHRARQRRQRMQPAARQHRTAAAELVPRRASPSAYGIGREGLRLRSDPASEAESRRITERRPRRDTRPCGPRRTRLPAGYPGARRDERGGWTRTASIGAVPAPAGKRRLTPRIGDPFR
jgi:hypothetical protein